VAEAVLAPAETACARPGLPFSEMKAMGLGVAGMIDRSRAWCAARRPLDGATVPFIQLLQARTPRTRLWISINFSPPLGRARVGAGRG